MYVISIHVFMNYCVQEDGISYNVLAAESFIRCCVPLFFICSGYFMFRKQKSIREIYGKLTKHILLPTLFVLLILFLFSGILQNEMNFTNLNREAVANFLKAIAGWNVYSIENGFYLWFMVAMIKIYMAYPVLALVCNEKREKICNYVIILLFVGKFCFQTINYFAQNALQIYGYSIFEEYWIFYVLLGYKYSVYYKNRVCSKKELIFGGIIYVIGSLLTYGCTVWIDVAADGVFNEHFFNYDSLTVLISAIGLFLFCKNIPIKALKVKQGITFIGRLTFKIYLVHYPVIMFLTGYGIRNIMFESLPRSVFYFSFIGTAFLVSLILAILFSVLWDWIGKGIYKAQNVTKRNKYN